MLQRGRGPRASLAPRDCGIRAYVPDELTVTYRGQAGGIRLQVADEDADAAAKVLEGAKQ